MIREYINELMLENDEKLKSLEQQMKQFLDELDYSKGWLETLQAEKNIDKNIFSPRLHDNDLKEKTEEAQGKIRETEKNIEHTRVLIEEQLEKKREYVKLLEELDNIGERTLDLQPETQKITGEESQPDVQEIAVEEPRPKTQEITREELQSETQELAQEESQPDVQEIAGEEPQPETQEIAGEEFQPDVQEIAREEPKPETHEIAQEESHAKKNADFEKSGSDPEEKEEREREVILKLVNQFLPTLYKKTEVCLALLYSDRNKCKSELKSMKTMIKNKADELKEKG